MSKFIPLSIPNFEGNEKKYVDDALEQGWVSTGGAYISKLEKQMAEFLHTDNVAACQSGTSALHLSSIVMTLFVWIQSNLDSSAKRNVCLKMECSNIMVRL